MKKSVPFACLLISFSVMIIFSGCWKKSGITRPPFKNSPYVGSVICAHCHEDIYLDYLTTGHSQQFQRVVDGQAPEYYWEDAIPFPIVNPPHDLAWSDVSLVLGGHYGYGVFFDQEGRLSTGPQSFWNIEAGGWGNYDPAQTAPYDCASCHMTGYDPAGIQEEFPSLKGSWEQNGVTCENCHGPGRAHVKSRNAEDILVDNSEDFCLGCHEGNPGHPLPGFADVDLGNSHIGSCSWCHNPHVSFKYEFERSLWRDCQDCHREEDAAMVMDKIKRNGMCGR